MAIKIPRIYPELGPDAPTLVHENGAKESAPAVRLQRVARALIEVGRVLQHGHEKYEKDRPDVDNWRGIDVESHLQHALQHALGHLAGDRSEGRVGHLTHLAARALFAIEVELDTQITDTRPTARAYATGAVEPAR